jgi:limonene 1,2-monooxygenase
VLGGHWETAEQRAAQFGTSVDRRTWRLVGPMHIRETMEQARADCEHGLNDWIRYFQEVAALPIAPDTTGHDSLVDAMNASGICVVGTPEMAIAQIQRLIDQSGGFGTYLFMAHEWADRQATLASYELFAREVMPAFQRSSDRTVRSRNWAADNRPEFMGAAISAVGKAIQDHQAEKEARAAPEGQAAAGA